MTEGPMQAAEISIVLVVALAVLFSWLFGAVVGLRWVSADPGSVSRWAIVAAALILGPITSLVLGVWLVSRPRSGHEQS